MPRLENKRSTVLLAAVGDLGKYLCEELLSDDRFDVEILSRKVGEYFIPQNIKHRPRPCFGEHPAYAVEHEWFRLRNVPIHVTDYSESSVLSVLEATGAKALISFLNFDNENNADFHLSLLSACHRSEFCKRFIPSEWAGNIDSLPHLPAFYNRTREPFRKELRSGKFPDVEWTLFNNGWLMDYFLPPNKTRVRPVPDFFPVDPSGWRAFIRGSGDEIQSWTCARDIAKAVVELLATADKWESVTYVAAEWSTFKRAVKAMEDFYGRPMDVSYKEAKQMHTQHQDYASDLDEWMLAGAAACPRDKTLRQRAKYFRNVEFSGLSQLLSRATKTDFI